MKYGDLIIEYRFVDVGPTKQRQVVSVEWNGPPRALVFWDYFGDTWKSDLQIGDRFAVGPFLVEIVGADSTAPGFIVDRVDQPWPLVRYYRLRYWWAERWLIVWRRIVLTLAIWDLATWPQGAQPGLENILERWRRGESSS